VYPTAIRAFGVSLCSSAGRVGGMIAPFIAQVKKCTNTVLACLLPVYLGLFSIK